MFKQYFVVFVGLCFLSFSLYVLWTRHAFDFLTGEKNGAVVYQSPIKTLHIGTVTDEAHEKRPAYDKLATLLKIKLQGYGVESVETVLADSVADMAVLLRQSKEDIYIDYAFPAFALSNNVGTDILLGAPKDELTKHHGVIFVSKRSGIKTLDDLKGKMLSLEEPFSPFGTSLPKAELMNAGYTVVAKKGPTDLVKPNEIGYYLTNDKDFIIKDVFRGATSGGAMDEEKFKEYEPEYKNAFTVLYRTQDIYHRVASVRKELPTELKNAIKTALLELSQSPQGKEALDGVSVGYFVDLANDPEFSTVMQTSVAPLQAELLTQ